MTHSLKINTKKGPLSVPLECFIITLNNITYELYNLCFIKEHACFVHLNLLQQLRSSKMSSNSNKDNNNDNQNHSFGELLK